MKEIEKWFEIDSFFEFLDRNWLKFWDFSSKTDFKSRLPIKNEPKIELLIQIRILVQK